MVYLSASPVKSHGRLKSSNCVVDNRWTLKLTDFGLLQFKANQNDVPPFNSNAGFLDETTIEAMPDNSQLTYVWRVNMVYAPTTTPPPLPPLSPIYSSNSPPLLLPSPSQSAAVDCP